MTFRPTDEQTTAIDLALGGESLKIEALAGAGKTSTLKLISEAKRHETGTYIAFNKAIVTDAAAKFPASVACSTAHALAMRAIGREYAHRLSAARVPSWELAKLIGTDPLQITTSTGVQKRLAPAFIALKAKEAIERFCLSGDETPNYRHVKRIDGFDEPGKWDVNREIAKHVEQYLAAYWRDLNNASGRLPYTHNTYLKQWQLSGPRISSDFILFDEAQDANAVMLSIVQAQTHAQRIYVGDRHQQIYEWNGAVNAMQTVETPNTTYLTRSFRFGQAVADVANSVLEVLGAERLVEGNPDKGSLVCVVSNPDAVLFRTNSGAVAETFRNLDEGKKVALVGGADEIIRFAKACRQLQDGRRTEHPDLACFDTWAEVKEAVDITGEASDLATLVRLIEENTPQTLELKLSACVKEEVADIIVSTAHKSKGREWENVRLGGDFTDPATGKIPPEEEYRLAYVASTRAMTTLDIDACAIVRASVAA